MWILNNETRFSADRTLICDRGGRDHWVVAVRGAFIINDDGSTEVAPDQPDVVMAPHHIDDPATSSLLYECDLDYAKPGTDVILHGRAYAPHGEPVRQVTVGMKVGGIQKTLRVFGDRTWETSLSGISLTPPASFTEMPIVYERAYGGHDPENDESWDVRNPVGVGFATKRDHLRGQRAPNIEDPRKPISFWSDRPQPIGFGPIARHWSPRFKLAGTYDDKWEEQRQPLLPEDFDEKFFLCAPQDQQCGTHLKGNEPVELRNLTPDGVMRFNLPRIVLGLSTRMVGETIHHRPSLHTVILEPDDRMVTMVWHSALPCHGRKHEIISTEVVQKKMI